MAKLACLRYTKATNRHLAGIFLVVQASYQESGRRESVKCMQGDIHVSCEREPSKVTKWEF
jgi:hypothetical protein